MSLGDCVEPGIAEDEIVGTAGGAVDRVVGVGVAGDELSSGERGEMAARREADHHNAIGADVVVRRAGADGLDGAARVDQGDWQQVAIRTEPVAEDESVEAARGKPVGHFAAFEVAGEMEICAAGKDDDG